MNFTYWCIQMHINIHTGIHISEIFFSEKCLGLNSVKKFFRTFVSWCLGCQDLHEKNKITAVFTKKSSSGLEELVVWEFFAAYRSIQWGSGGGQPKSSSQIYIYIVRTEKVYIYVQSTVQCAKVYSWKEKAGVGWWSWSIDRLVLWSETQAISWSTQCAEKNIRKSHISACAWQRWWVGSVGNFSIGGKGRVLSTMAGKSARGVQYIGKHAIIWIHNHGKHTQGVQCENMQLYEYCEERVMVTMVGNT